MLDFGANNSQGGSSQDLKEFQLSQDTQSKGSKEEGLRMARYIESTLSGTQGYYFLRNQRFKQNRLWAAGKVDIYSKFADTLQLNGKTNYINLNWSAIKIVNRIDSGLVGRWMGRQEKIQVTAIDPLSLEAKQEQYENAEFVLFNRAQLEQLQKESGVPMMSPDQFIPEDKDDLELWSAEGTRLPEEIKYEIGTNGILDSEGWYDVLKEKSLHDSTQTGLLGTYVWMDDRGLIHVEYIKPENGFYSYSDFPDFRDTTYRGFIKSMKISDIRRKYGKQFGGHLSEEELFRIAATCKEYQRYDKITWTTDWNWSYLRPYDEWNAEAIIFFVKSVDEDGWVVTTTRQNKSTLLTRSGRPPKLDDNQEFVDTDKWNIYKGVYLREAQVVLEWGIDDNMIRSQDPKESGNVEFPISFYMYQNMEMRNIALPEKIEEPVEQMILARLKIQQLVAKMKPAGSQINVDALEQLELGLSIGGETIYPKKVYEQTGDLYYRGRDAEGNPIPVPIQELQNSGFVAQLGGLIQLYELHYKVLKDELGEDPNLITAAATPRVTSENVQVSQQQADAATGYMYDAFLYLMEMTAKKIACLLNNSVRFGSKVYSNIMQVEDVLDRNFSTKIRMLPDQYEIMKFEGFLNQSLAANPDLSLFIDPFKLIRVAKENIKLAELLFRNGQKRMLRNQAEQARAQSEQNAQIQIASAQAKAESDFKLEKAKKNLEIIASDAKSKAENEAQFLKGYFELLKAGVQLPPEMTNLRNLMIRNIEMSVAQENQQMIQDAQMEQIAQQQEAAQMQEQQQLQPQ